MPRSIDTSAAEIAAALNRLVHVMGSININLVKMGESAEEFYHNAIDELRKSNKPFDINAANEQVQKLKDLRDKIRIALKDENVYQVGQKVRITDVSALRHDLIGTIEKIEYQEASADLKFENGSGGSYNFWQFEVVPEVVEEAPLYNIRHGIAYVEADRKTPIPLDEKSIARARLPIGTEVMVREPNHFDSRIGKISHHFDDGRMQVAFEDGSWSIRTPGYLATVHEKNEAGKYMPEKIMVSEDIDESDAIQTDTRPGPFEPILIFRGLNVRVTQEGPHFGKEGVVQSTLNDMVNLRFNQGGEELVISRYDVEIVPTVRPNLLTEITEEHYSPGVETDTRD